MNPAPLLRVEHLCAWYGAAQVLHGVELEVGRGEVVALMGRNGAGKSSTMKSLIGMGLRRTGAITFVGHDLSRCEPHEPARLGLGFVPEDRRIFTDLTVLENLEVGRQTARRWPDGSAAPLWSVERVFALFPALAALRHRRGAHMSGGEQQMLSIARTLMGQPFMLLLDEPTEGVAPIILDQLAHMIKALKAQGVSMLLSEQNLPFAARVSDRAYVLEKGVVRFHGSMQALQADTRAWHAFMGI